MGDPEEVDNETRRGLSRRQLVQYASVASLVAIALGAPSAPALAAEPFTPNLDDLDESFPDASAPDSRFRAASADWGGYENGRIPASAMTRVPATTGDPYLRSDAAASYFSLSNAYAAKFGSALPIREAYRSRERQEALYAAYQNGTGNYAAVPGTSVHGWALAIDFSGAVASYGTAQKNWMNANAPDYGWQPRGDTFTAQREPWHFEYDGAGAGSPNNPVPASKRTNMLILRTSQALTEAGVGYTALVGIRTLRHLSSAEQVDHCKSVGIPYYSVDRATFYDVINALSIPRAAITSGADYQR
jgi:hypothetical protein